MSYNKYKAPNHNTRNSGRYNTPGQFVPAGEAGAQRGYSSNMGPQQQQNNMQFNQPINPTQISQFVQPPQTPKMEQDQGDMDMSGDLEIPPEGSPSRPPWMKTRLGGVKKISNKERRRRQNETLRRLITPKNALMVLSEIMPGQQVTNNFKVEAAAAGGGGQFYGSHNFCAELNVEGGIYKGYGENKMLARNAAAEQAIRDLIIKRMARTLSEAADGSQNGEGAEDEPKEETLPMIQLASFALHKLFAEWECTGHKVPQLRPHTVSISDGASETGSAAGARKAAKPPKKKELPANAAALHPCSLLTLMRAQLAYRELAAEGDRPQNMKYTMAVDVDGRTFAGTATNKKEARKAAARAACEALFNVHFEPPHDGPK